MLKRFAATAALVVAAAMLASLVGSAAPAATAPTLPLRYQFHVGMDAPVRMMIPWNHPFLELEVGPDGSRYALDHGNRRVLRYAADGRLVNAWGWPGAGPGEFGPAGTSIDIGPTGDVFVGDPANGRVQRFTAWGAFVTDVCLGRRAGDGHCPPDESDRTLMAALPDGRFAVGRITTAADRSVSSTVTVHGADGTPERTWPIDYTTAIESDSRGRIVIALPRHSRVEVYDAVGTRLATLGRRGSAGASADPGTFQLCQDFGGPMLPSRDYDCSPRVVAIGPDDSIYATNGNRVSRDARIVRFLPDGSAVEVLRTDLHHFAVAGDGSIAVVDGAVLTGWSADGAPGPTWSADPPLSSPPPDGPSGAFFDPVAVAAVAGGAVLSDAGAGALQWLGPRGELGRREPTNPCNGGTPRSPVSALAPAPDGGWLAAFAADGCIQHRASDGVPGRSWGLPGAKPSAFGRVTAVLTLADDGFLVADPENGRLLAFGPDGAWRGEWGAGEFAARRYDTSFPAAFARIDMAEAPDGTIAVLDAHAERIVRFGADGRLTQAWSIAPHVGRAEGLAIGSTGTVFVTDSKARLVGRFTLDGAWLEAIGAEAGFVRPTAVAVGADGRLLVADPRWAVGFQEGRVVALDAAGTNVRPWLGTAAGDTFEVNDLHVLADGDVWASMGSTLLRLDPNGVIRAQVQVSPAMFNIGAIAERNGGTVLAAGTSGRQSTVADVLTDGTTRRSWRSTRSGPGSLERPTGAAAGAGPDGAIHLFAADAGAGRVVRFGWDGAYEREWTAGPGGVALGAVAQLAIAPDGSVWVADPDHHRVAHFTADGVPLGALGGDAHGLLRPSGVAVAADGTVIVADTGHQRLQAFHADGTRRSTWDGGDAPGARLRAPAGLALAADGTLWVADQEANRVVAFAAAPPSAWHVRTYRDEGLIDGPHVVQSVARLDLDWGAAPPAAGFALRAERPAGQPTGDRRLRLTVRGGAALFAPIGQPPAVAVGEPAATTVVAALHEDDWLRVDFAGRAAHPMLRLDELSARALYFPSALNGSP